MLFKFIIGPLLEACEYFYKIGLGIQQSLYRSNVLKSKRITAKVISVGNITWGGTGKTPLVMMIAQNLQAMQKRVVVLTRGYGNDEEHELRDRLKDVPIIVGKDRIKSAQIAIRRHGAEYILLDDGFQHIRLKRDIDIVNINSTNPFGNGRLIPAGILREPLEHLKRANLFVLSQSFFGRHNSAQLKQKLTELNPKAGIFEADHQPLRFIDFRKSRPLPLEIVRGQRVALLSAIEDPYSFENTMSRLDGRVVFAARYRDHHTFKKRELDEVFNQAREARARYLITTMKDAIRLKRLLPLHKRYPVRIIILEIELRMDDEEEFVRQCLIAPFTANSDHDQATVRG